jgi:uncharacterized protein (DUF433 family)
MLLEVLDDHGDVVLRQRVIGAHSQCRIGRSLGCDIPVDDPFAAPEHALLTLQEDGRVQVQDLGTRNGIRIDGGRIAREGRSIAGGELCIGRTRVRVRTSSEPLQPERLFRRDLLQVYRTPISIAGVLACLAFAVFMAWLIMPAQLVAGMLVGALAAGAALGVWAGVWALVSRLTVGAWQLRIHLALASVCLALWVWGYWLYGVAMFAFQWRRLTAIMVVLAGVVAFIVAWRHLRYATRLRRVATLSLALLAPLLGGGLWWLIDQQTDARTVNRVVQGPAIQPPSVRVSPSLDLADYLADAEELKREANRNRQQSLLASPILDEND